MTAFFTVNDRAFKLARQPRMLAAVSGLDFRVYGLANNLRTVSRQLRLTNIARHGGIAPTRWSRATNDSYFTIDAPWIIPALLSKVKIAGPVLEPAAGVGHMVRELRRGHASKLSPATCTLTKSRSFPILSSATFAASPSTASNG